MATLRVNIIEIEGASDETLREALAGHFRIPAAAPAVEIELVAPLALPPAPAGKKPGRKAPKAPAAIAPPPSGFVPASGSLGDRILTLVRKKPHSSAELIKATGEGAQKIYGVCNVLKHKGAIDSRFDDAGDGQRRWFVK